MHRYRCPFKQRYGDTDIYTANSDKEDKNKLRQDKTRLKKRKQIYVEI